MKTLLRILAVIVLVCGFGHKANAISVNEYKSSNFLTVYALHRSGTPDSDSQQAELYCNGLEFSPVEGVESYYINRNFETVAMIKATADGFVLLTADEEGEFTVEKRNLAVVDGKINFIDSVEDMPVNPGEMSSNDAEIIGFLYTVTFDANGKSYETDEMEAMYEGYRSELALTTRIDALGYDGGKMYVSLVWNKRIQSSARAAEVYEVYRDNGKGWVKIATTNETQYSDVYSGEESTQVKYYVKTVVDGMEKNSQVVAAGYTSNENGVTGIDGIESDKGMELNVYPNPTTDFVTVEGAEGNVALYSLNGALVTMMSVEEGEAVTIDVTACAKGMYVLKSGNKPAVKILIK